MDHENNNRASLVIGGVLVILGALFLVALLFEQNLSMLDWSKLWPLTIVAVGALFFVGMVLGGRSTAVLAIPGSIVSMVGLILWFQNAFGYYEAWSYAWALIVMAVGIGLMIAGKWGDQPGMYRAGMRTAVVGIILFLAFGAMMEFIFSLGSGDQVMHLFFPAGLMLVGLVLLARSIAALARKEESGLRGTGSLFWPVLLTGLGLIWTLTSLGMFNEAQVVAMLRLWPLLLIAIGADLIFGRRRPLVGGLIGLFLVAALLGFVWLGSPDTLAESMPWLYWGNWNSSNGNVRATVVGSGKIKTETRDVSGFSQVALDGQGVIEVIQGEKEGLVVEAEENLLPYLETRVVAGVLTIRPRQGYSLRPTQPIHYLLSVKDLRELNLNGSGQITADTLTTDELALNINGSGEVAIGALAAEHLDLEINGSGTVNAAGKVDNLEININGSGTFDGGDLKAGQVVVDISGAGNVTIWAEQILRINHTGSTEVSYYGSPEVIRDEKNVLVNSLGDK